jgi:predicted DsbA family dithiol-disulfide isomerase
MLPNTVMSAIVVNCVVDFMCPWTFIGLQSLQLAMKEYSSSSNIQVQLLPFEFDEPGKYPPEGTDWTEYCKSYGPQKADFLLKEKLPRAFRLGEEIGIAFDIHRRIVHTENTNSALMFVQEQNQSSGLDFSLRMLHHHFSACRDPNDQQLLTDVFTSLGIGGSIVEAFWKESDKAARNAEWTRQARMMGAPPVPKFIITCGESEENLCDRLPELQPTSPDFFRRMFQLCHEIMEQRTNSGEEL